MDEVSASMDAVRTILIKVYAVIIKTKPQVTRKIVL